MKLLLLKISCILVVAFCFSVLHAVGAEPPMWTFDDKDAEKELKSWIDLNQLAALEIVEVKDKKGEKRGVLKTESLGGDPYMFPGGGWNVANYDPIDGTQYNILYMAIRVNIPNFEVQDTDDFVDLKFVMERGEWQKRTITGFRIDPGVSEGIEAEIDYISLKGAPTSVEASGKTAISWGQLKDKF
jgi:hypothetical protein